MAVFGAGLALGVALGAPIVVRQEAAVSRAFAQAGSIQAGYSGRLIVGRVDGLWLLPLDGSAPSQIVAIGGGDAISGVSWDPSGTQVAYTRMVLEEGGYLSANLHLVDLAGNDRVLVKRDTPGVLLGGPAWAADGDSLLFEVYDLYGGGARRIDRVRLDGAGRMVEVVDGMAPSLSADGRALAYLRPEPAGMAIRVRHLADGVETEAMAAGAMAGIVIPSLAPDGASVVFAARGTSLAGPDGSGCPLPALPQGWLDVPAAQAHGVPSELWRVGSDGLGLARLTSTQCLDDPAVAWSPDGGWLAAYGGTSLILLRADGSAMIPVWAEGSYGGVDWAS